MTTAPAPLSSYFARALGGSAMTISGRPPTPSLHNHASLGRDNGAIMLLRRHHPALSTHRSISELGDGLVKAFQVEPGQPWPTRSIVLGHGASGYIEVGAGQFGWSEDGGLSLGNETLWAPQFARVSAPPGSYPRHQGGPLPIHRSIQFVSCSTANGPEGRRLLQQIADAGNLKVSGCTGLIFVNERSWFYERGAQLPYCIPSNSTAERCPESWWSGPLPSTKDVKGRFASMKGLGFDGGMEVEDVESIDILNLRTGRERSFPREVAESLLKGLFHSPPYKNDGAVPGALTARCTVKYRSQPPLVVSVLSDRLAELESGLVFLVSPTIRTVFESLEQA